MYSERERKRGGRDEAEKKKQKLGRDALRMSLSLLFPSYTLIPPSLPSLHF